MKRTVRSLYLARERRGPAPPRGLARGNEREGRGDSAESATRVVRKISTLEFPGDLFGGGVEAAENYESRSIVFGRVAEGDGSILDLVSDLFDEF